MHGGSSANPTLPGRTKSAQCLQSLFSQHCRVMSIGGNIWRCLPQPLLEAGPIVLSCSGVWGRDNPDCILPRNLPCKYGQPSPTHPSGSRCSHRDHPEQDAAALLALLTCLEFVVGAILYHCVTVLGTAGEILLSPPAWGKASGSGHCLLWFSSQPPAAWDTSGIPGQPQLL